MAAKMELVAPAKAKFWKAKSTMASIVKAL
jgi:hypothetical protein